MLYARTDSPRTRVLVDQRYAHQKFLFTLNDNIRGNIKILLFEGLILVLKIYMANRKTVSEEIRQKWCFLTEK